MVGVLKCQNVTIHQTWEFLMKIIQMRITTKTEKNKLMLEKFERLYDQLIKTNIRKKN